MSHFSQIKTQIRNLPALESALSDLGLDWQSGPGPVRGYQGQTETAEVVIPQSNGYDIGFRWNGEQYDLVADVELWNQELTVERFLSKVTQHYALHTVLSTTADQGFQVAKQEQDAEGNIRLVVQRWQG
ncbi:DUF1257 domain-containing protein [Lyngbya confervoides]|uniref:DUF1257 domain-containing protein n=1 Tax=Lyngbya confervoides BDU141951 TaxID=1574623 RepID=A0ABD4T2B5_9CYAN|nr:DUF1257 domain-containing protein [Lyngbya confervoides]MCM1982771.1 DUF1257 domain-containing protein [Lyngbya confervoides BDU141951]